MSGIGWRKTTAVRLVSSGGLIKVFMALESPKPGCSPASEEQWVWIIQGIIDRALLETAVLDDYLHWFHNQNNPIGVQLAYCDLSMFLSREVNNLYQDLNYRDDPPLEIDYGFLHNWDLRITAKIPQPTQREKAEHLEDYIPERQRRHGS